MSQYGILQVKSNEDINRFRLAEAEQAEKRPSQELALSNPISRLAAHCRTEWARARDGKQPIEERMLRSMRQREGKYSEEKLAAIRTMGGSEIKMMLTDNKCRTAIAWLKDVFLGSGERPFSCEATPLPDIPPEIKQAIDAEAYQELQQIMGMIPSPQELRERIDAYHDEILKRAKDHADKMAGRMEDKLDDEYIHGGLYECIDEFLDDFVTFPTAYLKGPVIQKKKEIAWVQDQNPVRPNGVKAVVKDKFQRTWYTVSPHDIYLTPEARNVQEGSLVERHRLSPGTLYNLIGVPGYDEDQIRGAMRVYGDGGRKDWLWSDSERSVLEGRPYEQIMGGGQDIDTLEIWTKVRGKWLQEWGMEGIEDPDRWYDACCWLIGEFVIRATLNDDPMGERPIFADSYVRVRNSPWGRGVPDLIEDLQNMCDAAARALSNNMGIASGPMAEVETDRLAIGETVTKMYPWRIIQTQANKHGTPGAAVRFFQPNSNVDALIKVFEFFSSLADEYTGIPKYAQGDPNIKGAGSTASGLSMLMNASSRTMKGVIANVDTVIIGTTRHTHRHIMLFDDEMENKGDVVIVAKASQALLHREAQQMRINETLMTTNNPVDFGLMGPEGRLQLLRASLRGLEAVDVDKVLPTNDAMLMQAFAARMQPQAGQQQLTDQQPEVNEPGTMPPPQAPQQSINGMPL